MLAHQRVTAHPNALAKNQRALRLPAILEPAASYSPPGLRLEPLGDRQRNAMGPHHTAPHPSGSKDQAGLLAQSLQPLRREALGRCPTPFLPWRSPLLPAAKSASWWCMSIPMASRPMAMSASRFPLAAAASPSRRCASCRRSVPISGLASSRAVPAPRCRWSEAPGPLPAGVPGRFLHNRDSVPRRRAPRMEGPMACCRDGTRAALVLASDSLIDPLEQRVSTANPRASLPDERQTYSSYSFNRNPAIWIS
jgi:hypothetical protein